MSDADAEPGRQSDVCRRFGTEPWPVRDGETVGVSRNLRGDTVPVNGLRHPPSDGTTGWFIWAGDYSEDPDFFVPLHVEHLRTSRPEVMAYLALPPGWRFLLAPGYEDVWEDAALLDV